ncbi:hypothetical protein SAY87_018620 [Trapa incisa]|uniref:Serine-threonine/tyrosine-protein kinase catalytic domain-containing protein n=1 Tax=Trapa incisa TaxID=236973 RepID=A0AAN7K335_9MYRT|nr:hypothetical protein SAY87_018620 [Trapa incisa]
MIEGSPPFSSTPECEVPKAYAANQRPPFRASAKHYHHGLKELIEECWHEEPFNRPTFGQVIKRLDYIYDQITSDSLWKIKLLKCFQSFSFFVKKDRTNPSTRSSWSSTIR